MHWIVTYIKWIMLVCGVLTFTMIQAAIAPHAALESAFGTTLDGPLAEIIVRNWGALIALTGAMLVYGAIRPANRGFALVVASTSKLTFVALVLSFGRQYLGHQAGLFVVVDLAMVALFVTYLVAARMQQGPSPS